MAEWTRDGRSSACYRLQVCVLSPEASCRASMTTTSEHLLQPLRIHLLERASQHLPLRLLRSDPAALCWSSGTSGLQYVILVLSRSHLETSRGLLRGGVCESLVLYPWVASDARLESTEGDVAALVSRSSKQGFRCLVL